MPNHDPNYLAETLSDLQFELLIRARIKHEFALAMARNANLEESHNGCRFVWSNNDKCMWHFNVGETYSLSTCADGEVLSATAREAQRMMDERKGNKLSLLIGYDDKEAQDAFDEMDKITHNTGPRF